jgi:hypothetical protein
MAKKSSYRPAILLERMTVRFDEPTRAHIERLAQADKIHVSEMVRQLVEIGLEAHTSGT